VALLKDIKKQEPRRIHLKREDLPEMARAIAKDFKLNNAQSQLLQGGVYHEPREDSKVLSPAMLPEAPLTFPITYLIGYLLYWFLRIASLGRFKTREESIRKWIQRYFAPVIEILVFQWAKEDTIIRWHGASDPDITQRRRVGIREIKKEIEKGYQIGWAQSLLNNFLEHHKYNFENPDAALTFGATGRSATATVSENMAQTTDKDLQKKSKKDSEKERRKIIIALIILLLLLALLMFFLCRIFMCCCCLCGCTGKRAAWGYAWLKWVPAAVLTGWIGIIRHRPHRWVGVRGAQFGEEGGDLFLHRVPLETGTKKGQGVAWMQGYVGIPFNPEPAGLLISYPLLFLNCAYFRWVRYSMRVVYITIIKAIITVVERHFFLWIKTSMGVKPGGRGFWSGFDNLVPPLITLYSCSISYISTTYAYVMMF
jgi:hypothetical protein